MRPTKSPRIKRILHRIEYLGAGKKSVKLKQMIHPYLSFQMVKFWEGLKNVNRGSIQEIGYKFYRSIKDVYPRGQTSLMLWSHKIKDILPVPKKYG